MRSTVLVTHGRGGIGSAVDVAAAVQSLRDDDGQLLTDAALPVGGGQHLSEVVV